MDQSAEDDAPIVGHGPECEWDEVRARMWCGQEHLDRLSGREPWWQRLYGWLR